MRGPPPKDEPPGRLFRLLLDPRPELPLRHRVQGAEGVPLRVRAIRSVDRGLIEDKAASGPTALYSGAFLRGIVAAALWTPDGPAFSSPEAAGALPQVELAELGNAVGAALCHCSPMYGTSDEKAWAKALEDGALANPHEMIALAGCVDLGVFGGVVPRPDRYWGLPLNALLDGHWMVFRAARAAVEKLREKKG